MIVDEAVTAARNGNELLTLSDRLVRPGTLPMPILLVTSAIHHALIRKGLRTNLSLIVEGERFVKSTMSRRCSDMVRMRFIRTWHMRRLKKR